MQAEGTEVPTEQQAPTSVEVSNFNPIKVAFVRTQWVEIAAHDSHQCFPLFLCDNKVFKARLYQQTAARTFAVAGVRHCCVDPARRN